MILGCQPCEFMPYKFDHVTLYSDAPDEATAIRDGQLWCAENWFELRDPHPFKQTISFPPLTVFVLEVYRCSDL